MMEMRAITERLRRWLARLVQPARYRLDVRRAMRVLEVSQSEAIAVLRDIEERERSERTRERLPMPTLPPQTHSRRVH